MDKKSITSMMHKLFRHRASSYTKQMMHPRREWLIGLFCFAVLVTLGGATSGYEFMKYKELHQAVTPEAIQVESYKKNTVQKALKIYNQKKQTFEDIKNNSVASAPALEATSTASSTVSEAVPADVAPELSAIASEEGTPDLLNASGTTPSQ
jgi:uncharacterized protein HemX